MRERLPKYYYHERPSKSTTTNGAVHRETLEEWLARGNVIDRVSYASPMTFGRMLEIVANIPGAYLTETDETPREPNGRRMRPARVRRGFYDIHNRAKLPDERRKAATDRVK